MVGWGSFLPKAVVKVIVVEGGETQTVLVDEALVGETHVVEVCSVEVELTAIPDEMVRVCVVRTEVIAGLRKIAVVTIAEGESGTVALITSASGMDETGDGKTGIQAVVVGWTGLAGAGLLQTTWTLRPELTPLSKGKEATLHSLEAVLMFSKVECSPWHFSVG